MANQDWVMTSGLVGSTPALDQTHEDHDAGANKLFGFWIYLMSDCILFASIFATFAVQSQSYAGGPSGKELFDLRYVLGETMLLLTSSLTYGLSALALRRGDRTRIVVWLVVTFVLGFGFVGMEVNEFHRLIAEGNGPNRSGYLSAFFTLVGTHGLHVSAGLVWMLVMMLQVLRKGLITAVATRMMCLSLFWHFLDIVWIGVFSIVYLMGVM
jgi:cytochrome o ubiquinol oxidase subunit III